MIEKLVCPSSEQKETIHNETEFDRDDFMGFFRCEESINTLSNDDREEVFCTILGGGCDFTKKLLDSILNDYCVDTIVVIEVPKDRGPRACLGTGEENERV